MPIANQNAALSHPQRYNPNRQDYQEWMLQYGSSDSHSCDVVCDAAEHKMSHLFQTLWWPILPTALESALAAIT